MIGLKNLQTSRLLLIAFCIAALITWKLTRLIILDFGFLWNLHIYLLVVVGVSSLLYFQTTKLTRLEVSFLLYLFFIIVSVVFNYQSPNYKFIGDYVISPLIFFPAVIVGKKLSDRSFFFVLNSVSALLLAYLVYEFISVNFLDKSLIFYGDLGAIHGSREFTRMLDWNGSIFLRSLSIASIRTMGVAFNVHATGTLIGAFAVYHLHFFLNSQVFKKSNFILALIYLVLLLSHGSGASILFFLILVTFIFRKKQIVVAMGPVLIVSMISVLIDRRVDIYLDLLPDYTILPANEFIRLATFGDNQVTPYTYGSEFRMLVKPFAMGFGAFMLFHVVLFFVFKYIRWCYGAGLDFWPVWYFIISIYLGSYHYNTIFVFPNCLFLFFFCGFIAGRYQVFMHGVPVIVISQKNNPEYNKA